MVFVVQDTQGSIVARAEVAGVLVSSELARQLAAYLELLAKWNRTINLTALPVDPPTDGAIDRLIIEPLIAAKLVGSEDRLCIDVGSGGGSPALPMALACPDLGMILVESRVRKAAFLREAIRHLGLTTAKVENCRMEALASRPECQGRADLITMRAVRPDGELLSTVIPILRPGGRLLLFGHGDIGHLDELEVIGVIELTGGSKLIAMKAL